MTLSAANVGEQAPTFSVVDSNGVTRKLSDLKGKFVVLEWHHDVPVPNTTKAACSGCRKNGHPGVVWLTVISAKISAAGQHHDDRLEGRVHCDALDTTPTMATPTRPRCSHMFIIDKPAN
jgi:hypothetical protein